VRQTPAGIAEAAKPASPKQQSRHRRSSKAGIAEVAKNDRLGAGERVRASPSPTEKCAFVLARVVVALGFYRTCDRPDRRTRIAHDEPRAIKTDAT
jgi:hypothetical protein